MFEQNFMRQGWECPKCGRVYSPSTSMCKYCGNESFSINTNNLFDFPSERNTYEEENSPMRDMTEDEKAEYRRVLDTLYKPTGLNLFDLNKRMVVVHEDI